MAIFGVYISKLGFRFLILSHGTERSTCRITSVGRSVEHKSVEHNDLSVVRSKPAKSMWTGSSKCATLEGYLAKSIGILSIFLRVWMYQYTQSRYFGAITTPDPVHSKLSVEHIFNFQLFSSNRTEQIRPRIKYYTLTLQNVCPPSN